MEEFEGQLNCLGENTEKYITFLVPIQKEVMRIEIINGEEITKTISYRLQLIDSARFIAGSLSNLVEDLAEGIHKIKCTNCNNCCPEYTNAKDDLTEYKCLCCSKKFDENLKKRFTNTYKNANHDIYNFILLL